MMTSSTTVTELVTTARANALAAQNMIDEITRGGGAAAGGDQAQALHAAIVTLEREAIDIYTAFEARMQHHFRRGPFSRKLKALLIEAGEDDLADRINLYYLAVNVLKHGKGDSYRALLKDPSPLIVLRSAPDMAAPMENAADADRPAGLVDVTHPGFFHGLTDAIVQATAFLTQR
ncbi:hypothetical protein [Loktanella salsilacus]|uniref:hypothetical protein n=1 Tax=Loktanella salsilacus TaxID=195913 RepID=UPI003735533E